MPSPSEAAEIQSILTDLTTLAARDLSQMWARINSLAPGDVRDYLLAALPDLVDQFASAAGAYTTQWYDDQDPASKFRAKPADQPDVEQLRASTRWALSPLFGVGTGSPLTMLAGVTQRAIVGVSRQTVLDNVNRESGATWARHASANACAFCAMVASRGAVYASKQSASRVTGRGKDMTLAERRARAAGQTRIGGRMIAGGSGVTRGKQKVGDKFHDHCHCIAVPVRPGRSYEPPSYVDKWQEAYVQATKETPGVGKYGAIDTKAVLANMRLALGTH